MSDMSSKGFNTAHPASPQDLAGGAGVPQIENALEPIGIIQEIAGSSSSIALDLTRLLECA